MFTKRSMGVLSAAAFSVIGVAGVSYADIVVTPSSMNGWTFGSFTGGGGGYAPISSGPYAGTAQMVNGPATPPLGSGSAHLATNAGYGNGAEMITTDNFDGTSVSAITSLSYWAYDMANNGQQFPYLSLAISTDGNPIKADGSNLDTLFFEPPYQTPSAGNPSLPDQGATALDEWQGWNAYEGGWWDNNGIASAGAYESPSEPGVMPLSAFLTAYPNAKIANPGIVFPGIGGVALQVGFGSSGDNFNGYVDDFTLGTDAGSTTYDFEAPEPASLGILTIGGLGLLFNRRKKRSAL